MHKFSLYKLHTHIVSMTNKGLDYCNKQNKNYSKYIQIDAHLNHFGDLNTFENIETNENK